MSVCCQQLEDNSPVRSPFTDYVCFNWYDGPAEGIVVCEVCGREYRFDWIEVNEEEIARVFALYPLPSGSLQAFREIKPKPWRLLSEEEREMVKREIERVCQSAQPNALIVKSRYSLYLCDNILAARWIEGEEKEDVRDWFAFVNASTTSLKI
jgi:hypothetical protein